MKIILDNGILKVDDKILIDANKKNNWVDPNAFAAIGEIWKTVRAAYMQGVDYNEALRDAVSKTFKIDTKDTEVELVGGIPSHWTEEKEGKIKPMLPRYRR